MYSSEHDSRSTCVNCGHKYYYEDQFLDTCHSCGKNASKTDEQLLIEEKQSQENENRIRQEYAHVIDVLETLQEAESYYKSKEKFTKASHIKYVYNKLKNEYFI